ncbi:MAG: hypothetical protein CRN43_01900 [Candidatus Nephrothrix sp. EaCA]|nr:MAG: hypothetical protein CRN43_01900 [Candidatus Nephrothrix sp. EaCA]
MAYASPAAYPNPSSRSCTLSRLCIYPKDIQILTGKSERHGRNLIKKIKESLHKHPFQVVTVEEFCRYMGLPLETVVKKLR